jgi:hypothetical protein
MMRVYLEGIGLVGPGLEGWEKSQPVLSGAEIYVSAPTVLPPAALLPPNERRRAPKIVKIALAVGAEAFAAARRDPASVATIFTSSGGDGDTIHEILTTLASPQRELSPTRFHNSAHKTAAGYWSIATGAKAATTSLCCHDGSFAAGLLEAVVQAVDSGEAVALIAYDVPYPPPLSTVRPIGGALGAALLLSPTPSVVGFAQIGLTIRPGVHAPTQGTSPGLEELRCTTPTARCLPLLEALASGSAVAVMLEYLSDMALRLDITPCLASG